MGGVRFHGAVGFRVILIHPVLDVKPAKDTISSWLKAESEMRSTARVACHQEDQ
jgi:hypothetical protein